MKVKVIEANGKEHEVEMEPPFSGVWCSRDGRLFMQSRWERGFTVPVFTEATEITPFDLPD